MKTDIKQLRAGWTVIELIFIIVIIGILASIAIKSLSTTRDDAKLSTTVANMSICIKDAANHYTATSEDFTDTFHSSACDVNNTACYVINYATNGEDFNVTLNKTGAYYCEDIAKVGGHLEKSYSFGGSTITR